MTELDTLAKKFGVSVPVYEVRITEDKSEVVFALKNSHNPADDIDSDDPVLGLLSQTWSEHLNKEKGILEASINREQAYRIINADLREFVKAELHLKNPKQSKLYKWLCANNQYTLTNGFISVWRYIKTHAWSTTETNRAPHVQNVLAILELLRSKDEA